MQWDIQLLFGKMVMRVYMHNYCQKLCCVVTLSSATTVQVMPINVYSYVDNSTGIHKMKWTSHGMGVADRCSWLLWRNCRSFLPMSALFLVIIIYIVFSRLLSSLRVAFWCCQDQNDDAVICWRHCRGHRTDNLSTIFPDGG